MSRSRIYLLISLVLLAGPLLAQHRVLDKRMHHLRAGDEQEWDFLKGKAEKQATITFKAQTNPGEMTLRLKHEEVKLGWNVYLNGYDLGKLDPDENARIQYLTIPPHKLKTGDNTLLIAYTQPFGRTDRLPDDILVGEIDLFNQPVGQLLRQSPLAVSVFEKGTNRLIPARLTITNVHKALQPVDVVPGQPLAVRTGCIYTGNGKASFSLPEGMYKIYASRGFEYTVDSLLLVVKKGKPIEHTFRISREVPTQGWISADTHLHTFTNSRHGDATVEERLLTVAGEDIDLPVFTDHNFVFDVKPTVQKMGMGAAFTPVTGNEFTTEVGHFNVFPLADTTKAPNHQVKDWAAVSRTLGRTDRVLILNHARDAHYNFRPFGPERYISIAGQDLAGWEFPANAMEVINSSAQLKDIMQLYRDWFGVLNRGHLLTPVGSSDSHDVMRYLVGQGRTYIRYPDTVSGSINVEEAIRQFRAGRVMTCFGLMADIKVNKRYGPGELAPASGEVTVSVRVLGPSWIKANRVSLYANGQKIREISLAENGRNGVKWEGSWTIPIKTQDTYFVAIAEGPDPALPFWPIPKPYSRISSEWHPQVIGSSGAVWVDADKDQRKTSAYAYAGQLLDKAEGNAERLFDLLNEFDEAVVIQVASLLQAQKRLSGFLQSEPFKRASPAVKAGFEHYRRSLEESLKAIEAAKR